MFGFFKKRRAIKSFVRDMGPALRQEFGKKPHYTAEEVQKVARRNPAYSDYLPYAMCMFSTPVIFHALYSDSSEGHDYNAIRQEIGSSYFGGDTSFNADTVIEAGESSSDSGWSSGGDSGGGWDSGGGGDSGCGGGGGGD